MKSLFSFVCGIGVLTVAALSNSMPAKASAPILIWPVDPVIEADRGAGALWLENRGTSPVVMQIRVYRWTQADGEDQFEEQQDVEVSPPMARIQPGARQLVRLTSDQKARAPGEGAYRIVVDEVPVRPTDSTSSSPDSPAQTSAGVRFRMRYSIPLFVYSPLADGTKLERDAPPRLRCSLAAGRVVTFFNEGNTHARLVGVSFDVNGQPAYLAKSLLGYALPGKAISRPLPDGTTGREPLTRLGKGGVRIAIPGCVD